MTNNEIAALSAVILSIGTNVALYMHLSATMKADLMAWSVVWR